MERRVEFVGSIIIFFILLFVYSKWGPSIPISVLTQTKGEPLVVTETGKTTVVPDIAVVSFGIDTQGQNLKQVQESVNTKSKNLTDALKKLGIKEDDIKTSNYNVYPEYDYNQNPFRISGYRVTTTYEVKIDNFELVNEALVIATQNGANMIGNISFEVNEKTREETLDNAREEAVKKAKTKAEGLAKTTGITLGKIINVSESYGSDYPRPIMYTKDAIGSAEQLEVANITPGETELEVTISLSYEVR